MRTLPSTRSLRLLRQAPRRFFLSEGGSIFGPSPVQAESDEAVNLSTRQLLFSEPRGRAQVPTGDRGAVALVPEQPFLQTVLGDLRAQPHREESIGKILTGDD